MGYVHPLNRHGLYLNTDLIDPSDFFEIRESADRRSASFTVLRGGVREKRYSFKGEIRSDAPSDDRAPALYYRRDAAAGGWAVVSEPLEAGEGWVAVEPGTMVR